LRQLGTVVCLVASASLPAPAARAAPLPAPAATADPTAAQAAIDLARYHYGKGDYKAAARLFLQAFSLDPRPDSLFNAARAEQRGFELDDAERDFLAFLKLPGVSPESSHRAEVHLKEVRETRAQLEQAKAKAQAAAAAAAATAAAKETAQGPGAGAATQPTTPSAAPPAVRTGVEAGRDGPRWRRIGAWSAIGVGAVGLGLATFQGLDAASAQSTLDGETGQLDGNQKITGLSYDAYRSRQTAIYDQRDRAYVVGALGLVAVGVGAVLLATDAGPVAASVWPQRGGAVVALTFGADATFGGAR